MAEQQIVASPGFASWLAEADVSLAFTTYQRGRLFFLGRRLDGTLWAHERWIDQCQGLWSDGRSLWVSSLYQLWHFHDARAPGTAGSSEADRMFHPRSAHFTGRLDVHDIGVNADGRPVFVNTAYGCLATLSDSASFRPLWRPPFVSALVPEDRCHLNGLAMLDGEPRFATAVSRSDVVDGWRDRRRDGGVLVDVRSGEIVAAGLSMPHSPRLHDGRLWLLNSGTGEFGTIDPGTGRFEPACFCPGYARGLAFAGDHAVIGVSRPRENRAFDGLALEDRLAARDAEARCGLLVVDRQSGVVREWVRLDQTLPITEIYDVAVLPGVRQPWAIGLLDGGKLERAVTVEEYPA